MQLFNIFFYHKLIRAHCQKKYWFGARRQTINTGYCQPNRISKLHLHFDKKKKSKTIKGNSIYPMSIAVHIFASITNED